MRQHRHTPDVSLSRTKYNPGTATRRGAFLEIDLQGNAARTAGPVAQALLRLKKQARLYHRLACMTSQQQHRETFSL